MRRNAKTALPCASLKAPPVSKSLHGFPSPTSATLHEDPQAPGRFAGFSSKPRISLSRLAVLFYVYQFFAQSHHELPVLHGKTLHFDHLRPTTHEAPATKPLARLRASLDGLPAGKRVPGQSTIETIFRKRS